jgi:hypothetical protein
MRIDTRIDDRRKRKRPTAFCTSLLALALLLGTVPPPPLPVDLLWAGEKITIGEVEDVILLPWGVKLPARIDTGAGTSSLDARDLRIEGNVAEFRLPKKYGGLTIRLPVVEWRHVRSADAGERRPVVEFDLCMGPKRIRTRVTLNDRSMVKYPLIIGRSVLKENFVVDCERSNCSPPKCPEAPRK